MYSQEFIETLKNTETGRMVTFKPEGDFLIDTYERVLNTFFKVLAQRFKDEYYYPPEKIDEPLLDELKEEILGVFEKLPVAFRRFKNSNEIALTSYQTHYENMKKEYDEWDAWIDKVEKFLADPIDKWQAVLLLNEMRCEDCKDDMIIRSLKLEDTNNLEVEK